MEAGMIRVNVLCPGDSMHTFRGSFGPNAAQIQGDMPNSTNVRPLTQISEVKI
jgi:hypothetical protein